MKRARAVIGANFGDEGKGLITDYLCSQGAGVVVRFNGGAQAGHTVQTPDRLRHVFQHVGSGAFQKVPTYLSRHFIVNPIAFLKELDALNKIGVVPTVFAHPDCLVSTHVDAIINQALEDKRGVKRHGSVGLGIGETVERSSLPNLKITMADIWNHRDLRSVLFEAATKYAAFRTGGAIDTEDAIEKMSQAFCRACDETAARIHPAGIEQCAKLDPVFEGAQGLLLSQDNKAMFPHVTRSYTGIRNVRELCAQAGIDTIEAYYVSRTYLTRHGAGPLPGEDPGLRYNDDTNHDHAYQGKLRFAPLDVNGLLHRCDKDFGPGSKLVLTHCDQEEPPRIKADLMSFGPTRTDVERTKT